MLPPPSTRLERAVHRHRPFSRPGALKRLFTLWFRGLGYTKIWKSRPRAAFPVPRFRTIWISDLRLGTRSADAGAGLGVLATHQADRYYLVGDILVGDIVDGWALGRS
jgi:hypothetical protein